MVPTRQAERRTADSSSATVADESSPAPDRERDGREMTVHIRDLSDDARVLLRLLSRRTSLHHAFSTADVLALTPNHQHASPQGARVPMSEEDITTALAELSHPRGWLGTFRPGRYVFRALATNLPDAPGNPDRRDRTGKGALVAGGREGDGGPWAHSRTRAVHHPR
jgi:hypothetical protein